MSVRNRPAWRLVTSGEPVKPLVSIRRRVFPSRNPVSQAVTASAVHNPADKDHDLLDYESGSLACHSEQRWCLLRSSQDAVAHSSMATSGDKCRSQTRHAPWEASWSQECRRPPAQPRAVSTQLHAACGLAIDEAGPGLQAYLASLAAASDSHEVLAALSHCLGGIDVGAPVSSAVRGQHHSCRNSRLPQSGLHRQRQGGIPVMSPFIPVVWPLWCQLLRTKLSSGALGAARGVVHRVCNGSVAAAAACGHSRRLPLHLDVRALGSPLKANGCAFGVLSC